MHISPELRKKWCLEVPWDSTWETAPPVASAGPPSAAAIALIQEDNRRLKRKIGPGKDPLFLTAVPFFLIFDPHSS